MAAAVRGFIWWEQSNVGSTSEWERSNGLINIISVEGIPLREPLAEPSLESNDDLRKTRSPKPPEIQESCEPRQTCPHCFAAFATKGNPFRHNCIPRDFFRFRCNRCGTLTASQSSFSKHSCICGGYGHFSDDVFFMLDKRLGWYWRITWTVTSPLVLFIIFIFAMLDQKDPLKYGKYVYPSWAVGIGWAITLFVMLQIPFWAAVSIYRAPGNTFLQKLRRATRPSPAWGPSDASLKDQWKVATGQTAPGIKVELRKFTPGETTNDLGGVENKAYTVSEQDAH
ncbi:sodium and chloride-dependent glycine transporter 2 [Ixodes scapularis]